MTSEEPITPDGARGPTVGPYVLAERIGAGGFATVFRAIDTRFNSPVALKVLAENWAGNQDARMRFADEARVLRRLQCPDIIPVYDVGEIEGKPYMAMQLASGNLESHMAEISRPFNSRELGQLSRSLGRGLAHTHRAGVVHRDIKPSNLLLLSHDESPVGNDLTRARIVLGDFGLAKDLARASGITRGAGTAWFQAPEQSTTVSQVDYRADIYSAGAVMAWAATGSVPYPGSTWQQHLELHQVAPALSAQLNRALAVTPQDRPESVSRWAENTASTLEAGQPLAKDVSPKQRSAPVAERSRTEMPQGLPMPRQEPPSRPRWPALATLALLASTGLLLWWVTRPPASEVATPPSEVTTTSTPNPSPVASPEPPAPSTATPWPSATPQSATPEPATPEPTLAEAASPGDASDSLETCSVDIPPTVSIHTEGQQSAREPFIWVMENSNLHSSASDTTVLEPGSLLANFGGRRIYAKAGSTIGGTGSGGLDGAAIFYEDGVEIARGSQLTRQVTFIRCDEIVTSQVPPESVQIPATRPVVIGFDRTLSDSFPPVEIDPDPRKTPYLSFATGARLCLDRIHWNAFGIASYSNTKINVTWILEYPDSDYRASRDLALIVDGSTSGSSSGDQLLWRKTDVFRDVCIDNLPGPGSYQSTVILDVDGTFGPSDPIRTQIDTFELEGR